jgi:hypothetical protein
MSKTTQLQDYWNGFLQVLLQIQFTLLAYLRLILQTIFEFVVEIFAALVSSVLSHPAVVNAAANTVVEGMNRFITQPDLDKHFKIMSDSMARNQGEMAAKAGQEFPKIVGSFLHGMIMAPTKKGSLENGQASIIANASATSTSTTTATKDNTSSVLAGILPTEKAVATTSTTPVTTKAITTAISNTVPKEASPSNKTSAPAETAEAKEQPKVLGFPNLLQQKSGDAKDQPKVLGFPNLLQKNSDNEKNVLEGFGLSLLMRGKDR